MIYLLGASHMGVVLKSWLTQDDLKLIEEFGKVEPSFVEFKTNDGNSILKILNKYNYKLKDYSNIFEELDIEYSYSVPFFIFEKI